MYSADLDGDNLNDVIAASDSVLVWWPNMGNGTFGEMDTLTTDLSDCSVIFSDDFDNDGDNDIVVNSNEDFFFAIGEEPEHQRGVPPPLILFKGSIFWFENFGGANFSEARLVTDTIGRCLTVTAADLDGDNDMEIIGGTGNELSLAARPTLAIWFENEGNSTFGSERILSDTFICVESIKAGDIDNDGDNDIVCAHSDDGRLLWFENMGGGNFSTQNYFGEVISSEDYIVFDIEIADLDQDSLKDIIANYYDMEQVVWYRNLEGDSFTNANFINEVRGYPLGINAQDIDGDNKVDILISDNNNDQVVWIKNLGGANFEAQTVIDSNNGGAAVDIYAIDFEGDSLPEVLTFLTNTWEIAWHENLGNGAFGSEKVLTPELNRPQCVYATDIDNDGDNDVLTASSEDERIALFENLGNGNFSSPQTITTEAEPAYFVYAADLDGDLDLDVLSGSGYSSNDKVAWYENLGNNVFGSQQVISSTVEDPRTVFAVDLDNDNDNDVIIGSYNDGALVWFENLGNGNFGIENIITEGETNLRISYGDLDNDSLIDIVTASSGQNRIAWFKNLGNGLFSSMQIVENELSIGSASLVADINQDGKKDIVSSVGPPFYTNSAVWYENLGGGTFSAPDYIYNFSLYARSFHAAELNGDGILDLLSGGSNSGDKVVWSESIGNVEFSNIQTITTDIDLVTSVYAADLDGDGDLDALSASSYDNMIAWYENLSNIPVGLEETKNIASLISPNPYSKYSLIHLTEDIEGDIIITDLAGKTILRKNFSGKRIELSVTETGNGFFLAYLQEGNKRSFLGKLIVVN